MALTMAAYNLTLLRTLAQVRPHTSEEAKNALKSLNRRCKQTVPGMLVTLPDHISGHKSTPDRPPRSADKVSNGISTAW